MDGGGVVDVSWTVKGLAKARIFSKMARTGRIANEIMRRRVEANRWSKGEGFETIFGDGNWEWGGDFLSERELENFCNLFLSSHQSQFFENQRAYL